MNKFLLITAVTASAFFAVPERLHAQQALEAVCGAVPDLPTPNEQIIKGQLDTQANLLSKFVGKAELSGQIENVKRQLYQNSEQFFAARQDAYLLHAFCILLMQDTSLSTLQKFDAIAKYRNIAPPSPQPAAPKPPPPSISSPTPRDPEQEPLHLSHAKPPPLMQGQRQYLIFFDWDRANVTPEGGRIIRLAAEYYDNHCRENEHDCLLWVTGYTSQEGPPETLALSEHRAQAVADWLVAFEIPKDRLRVAARGSADPRVPVPNGTREPQNRRVEINIQSQWLTPRSLSARLRNRLSMRCWDAVPI